MRKSNFKQYWACEGAIRLSDNANLFNRCANGKIICVLSTIRVCMDIL